MNFLARLIVHLSALLAPRHSRARWREEWLGEIESQKAEGKRQKRGWRTFRGALGAPMDASVMRSRSAKQALSAIAAGWRTDVRQTLRTLWHAPSHVATVVICLGVGIAVCVSAFSAINALLFGEIPGIADRVSVVRVFLGYEDGRTEGVGGGRLAAAGPLSLSDFEILNASHGAALTALAVEGDWPVAVSLDREPVPVTAAFVSSDYFRLLGTDPFMGRLLRPDDDRPDAAPAAVIGYHLWRDRFDAAADIVGRSILVGHRTFTVVGVTPPRFTGTQPPDIGESPLDHIQVWVPLRHAAGWPGLPGAETAGFRVIGRLALDATHEDALIALKPGTQRLAAAYPESRRGAYAVVRSLGFGPDDDTLEILLMVAIMLSVPLTVLAISCANVANLQLARATDRARELAVRVALGASRGQVVRLLTFEAAALAMLAVMTGWMGARVILIVAQPTFPLTLALDRRVLAFALLLAAGVTVLSGLAPAWIGTRRAGPIGLKQSSRGGGVAHSRLRHALVVVQMALSLALLATSGLFLSSLRAMRSEVPPAAPATLVSSIDPEVLGFAASETRQLRADLAASLALHPRVQSAAFEQRTGIRYWSATDDIGVRRHAACQYVTERWFSAANARVIAGRPLHASDAGAAAVVSERLARELVPDGSVIGKLVYVADSNISQQSATTLVLVRPLAGQPTEDPATRRAVEIVGVIANIPRRPGDTRPDPLIYLPMSADAPGLFTLRVRTDEATAKTTQLQDLIRQADRRLQTVIVQSAEALFLREADPTRMVAMSIGALGIVALLLAAAGLYAVMAYLVSLRRQEIGVRMAIGARPGDVITLVFRQGVRLAVFGSLAGFALATPIAMGLRSAFVGVSPFDPAAMLPPAAVLMAVTLMASAIPARRAARIDPIRALRDD
jgi:predicted permease